MYRSKIDKSEARKNIDNFLNLSTIGFVGVSSKKKDFSQGLFKEMKKHFRRVIPINPQIEAIDDSTCYPSLASIPEKIEGLFIMTSPINSKQIVQKCIDLNIDNLWFHRGVGQGSLDDEIYYFAKERGLNIIPGYCPYMFLPDAGLGHKLHGMFMKLTRSYPN
jgi:predicted CoA-binding protein